MKIKEKLKTKKGNYKNQVKTGYEVKINNVAQFGTSRCENI